MLGSLEGMVLVLELRGVLRGGSYVSGSFEGIVLALELRGTYGEGHMCRISFWVYVYY